MNKLILVVLVCTSGIFASAGTSAQDPTVAQLRNRFKLAHVPSLNELNLSKEWNCSTFQSSPGNFTSTQNQSLTLNSFDGMIQFTQNLNASEVSTLSPKNFSFQETGLVSVMPYIPEGATTPTDAVAFYVVLRADRNDTLLSEWLVKGITQKGRDAISKMENEEGLAYREAKAWAYSVCIKK